MRFRTIFFAKGDGLILQKYSFSFLYKFCMFSILSECLRWGPTSLKTVRQNIVLALQFLRSWGPKTK